MYVMIYRTSRMTAITQFQVVHPTEALDTVEWGINPNSQKSPLVNKGQTELEPALLCPSRSSRQKGSEATHREGPLQRQLVKNIHQRQHQPSMTKTSEETKMRQGPAPSCSQAKGHHSPRGYYKEVVSLCTWVMILFVVYVNRLHWCVQENWDALQRGGIHVYMTNDTLVLTCRCYRYI